MSDGGGGGSRRGRGRGQRGGSGGGGGGGGGGGNGSAKPAQPKRVATPEAPLQQQQQQQASKPQSQPRAQSPPNKNGSAKQQRQSRSPSPRARGGGVQPPKPAPVDDLAWAVGKALKLELATPISAAGTSEGANATVEGVLYAYDARNGVLVLLCTPAKDASRPPAGAKPAPSSSSSHRDLRFISTLAVRSVVLQPSTDAFAFPAPSSSGGSASSFAALLGGSDAARVPVPEPVAWEASMLRESASLAAMEAKLARVNARAGADAQKLFDALCKTMECRWHGETMVVMEAVLVEAPYTPECVKGNNASAVARVRKVVQGERRKLRLES